jgi:uncharacterized membrane protein YkvA (DUF1232 family)
MGARCVQEAEAKAWLKEIVLLIPNFVKLIYRLMQDERIDSREKLILGGAVAYVMSPIDLIPDFVPFLGQLDDLVLIALVLKRLFNTAGDEVLMEHWDGKDELLGLIDRTLEVSKLFVPDKIYNLLVARSQTPPEDQD